MFEENNRNNNTCEQETVPVSQSSYNVTDGGNKKDKKGFSGKAVAVMLVICMTVSAALGFFGNTVYNNVIPSVMEMLRGNRSVNETRQVSEILQTAVRSDDTQPLSIVDIVKEVADTVVEITTEAMSTGQWIGNYVTEGAGSGVIISEDGYIITNHHVIEDTTSITVTTRSGSSYKATLIGSDSKNDIAVLKIDASGLTFAKFGDSSALQVGELAVAVGNPLGKLGGSVTEGIISALGRTISVDGTSMTLLQTSAAINPGNSGGGLFNEYGELIGVVNAKASGDDVEGLGFAIPSNVAYDTAADLIEHGYVQGRAYLGIKIIDIQDIWTASQYRVSELGVYVVENSGSFVGGDRIVSLAGTEIKSSSDIEAFLQNHQAGETIEVIVSRNGENVTFNTVLLQQMP